MRLLSRQANESIMVGDDVEIIVVEITGDKVRLGIKTPIDIPIHTKEIYEESRRAKAAETQERDSRGPAT